MSFWSGRRVFLTGGHGFLGRVIRGRLEQAGAAALVAPRSSELNLLDRDRVRGFLAESRPDVIIHAAAVVGGIGANARHPGRFFYENAAMGIHLIEEARLAGVEKFVCVGTTCAYPKFAPMPFREEDLWNGYPEETNAPYGLAKRMLAVQLDAYRAEYDFNGIFLLPANLYGPGDNFDPGSSHVVPAIIRKCAEAVARGDAFVELWGDGSPTRDFLYVDDAAEGIVRAAEAYESAEPLNIGSGDERSIREIAEVIARATGFTGELRWDTSKPNGQPRRRLDTSRATATIGFTAATPFDVGLERTVAWWKANGGA